MRRTIQYVIMIGVLGGLCSGVPGALAADQAAAQQSRTKLVTIEGATTTYQVEGMYGQTVTVDVPSQSAGDVKLSNPAQGTVQGRVVVIDGEKNQVKVHTQEGQTLVLAMEPTALRGLRLGDQFTLAVPRPAGR